MKSTNVQRHTLSNKDLMDAIISWIESQAGEIKGEITGELSFIEGDGCKEGHNSYTSLRNISGITIEATKDIEAKIAIAEGPES
jgi:hypothetical protein